MEAAVQYNLTCTLDASGLRRRMHVAGAIRPLERSCGISNHRISMLAPDGGRMVLRLVVDAVDEVDLQRKVSRISRTVRQIPSVAVTAQRTE